MYLYEYFLKRNCSQYTNYQWRNKENKAFNSHSIFVTKRLFFYLLFFRSFDFVRASFMRVSGRKPVLLQVQWVTNFRFWERDFYLELLHKREFRTHYRSSYIRFVCLYLNVHIQTSKQRNNLYISLWACTRAHKPLYQSTYLHISGSF